MTALPIPTEDELRGYLETLSNWGRWGHDDTLGTLNFVTPAARAAAASSRAGRSEHLPGGRHRGRCTHGSGRPWT